MAFVRMACVSRTAPTSGLGDRKFNGMGLWTDELVRGGIGFEIGNRHVLPIADVDYVESHF